MKIIPNKNKALRIAICSAFLSCLTLLPVAEAGPKGGNIIGGTGNINQPGLNTTINQNSASVAINWNSFNVNAYEKLATI